MSGERGPLHRTVIARRGMRLEAEQDAQRARQARVHGDVRVEPCRSGYVVCGYDQPDGGQNDGE